MLTGSWDSLYHYHDGASSPRILCAQGKVLPPVAHFLRSLLLFTYSVLIHLCLEFPSPSRVLRGFPLVNEFLAFVTVLHLACSVGPELGSATGCRALGFPFSVLGFSSRLWPWVAMRVLLERHVEPQLSLPYLFTGLLRKSTYLLNL